jgi:hypothetical protein
MEENKEELVAVMVGKHADKLLTLIQAGFFDMRAGSVTCHFDDTGAIRKIEKNIIFKVV